MSGAQPLPWGLGLGVWGGYIEPRTRGEGPRLYTRGRLLSEWFNYLSTGPGLPLIIQ